MRRFSLPLTIPTAAGAGPVQSTRDLQNMAVQFGATFAGNLTLEASIDGTHFVPVATGITAPSIHSISLPAMFVRVRVNSLTSGTPSAVLAGDYLDG